MEIRLRDLNPRRAGAPKLPWSAGGGGVKTPPSYSAPRRRSEKRGKAFESSSKIIPKLFQSLFAQVNIEVTRGHQRSNDSNGFSLVTFELRKLAKEFGRHRPLAVNASKYMRFDLGKSRSKFNLRSRSLEVTL